MESKRCKKCSAIYPSDMDSCPSCSSKKPSNEQTNKNSNIGCFIVVILVIGGIYLWGKANPSQYEKDVISCQNKTWNEMTSGEKEACEDVIEWQVEERIKENDGKLWDN